MTGKERILVFSALLLNHESIDELKDYLLKKTKTGKWQKRYFATNGCFLTYYKKQGEKLLAALNLPQVGTISQSDEEEGIFTIELHERIYTIKTKNKKEAERWVHTLQYRQSGGKVKRTECLQENDVEVAIERRDSALLDEQQMRKVNEDAFLGGCVQCPGFKELCSIQ